jgi:Adenylate and Guanylate cyclase catalytic domain
MFAVCVCRMLANMTETDRYADMQPVNWSDLGVSELPTGTVTLLLADVEGSTRLWQIQPGEMSAAIARLDRAVSDLVAVHNGVRPVEQGEGDSFVVAFGRASDAAAFALQLQLTSLSPISLRIGLHTGEVQLRDEANYVGPTSGICPGPNGCRSCVMPIFAMTSHRFVRRKLLRHSIFHHSLRASSGAAPTSRTCGGSSPTTGW